MERVGRGGSRLTETGVRGRPKDPRYVLGCAGADLEWRPVVGSAGSRVGPTDLPSYQEQVSSLPLLILRGRNLSICGVCPPDLVPKPYLGGIVGYL